MTAPCRPPRSAKKKWRGISHTWPGRGKETPHGGTVLYSAHWVEGCTPNPHPPQTGPLPAGPGQLRLERTRPGQGRAWQGALRGGAAPPYLLLHPDHAVDLGAVLKGNPLRGRGQVLQAPDVDVIVSGTRRPELLLLRQKPQCGRWQASAAHATHIHCWVPRA